MVQGPLYEDMKKRISELEKEVEDLKAVSQSLRESERKYRSILNRMEEEYYEVDLNGNFTFFNEAVCRNHGYSSDELMGMNYEAYMPPQVAEKVHRVFSEVYRTGVPAKTVSYDVMRKDGSIRANEMSVSLMRDANGAPSGFYGISMDRTELLQKAQALRESEESHRNILELAPDSITISRISDGRYLQVNDAFCQRTGYSQKEAMGRTAMELNLYANPEDRDRLLEILRRDGQVEALEIRFQVRDGTIRDNLVSARRVQFRGEDCLLIVSTNIASLKAAQKALAESEESYRSILALAPDAIVIARAKDGKYVQVNDAFCEVTGYSPAEAIGRTGLDLNLYPDPGERKRLLDALRRDGRLDGLEMRFQAKDGKVMEHLVSARPIRFKGEDCVLVMATGITTLKEVQRALRESEEKYRLLFENASEAIYITQDDMVKFSNPNTETLTGYSAAELEKKPFMNLIHSKDRDAVQKQKDAIAGQEHGPTTYSFRIRSKQGNTRWVELNDLPINWEGKPAILNFLRDVTVQKRMEVQLLQARKMEAIGTLAGGIAHDFNNLLMGIQGNTSLMLLDVTSGHPHYENLKSIEKMVQHGSGLTKQLLGVARGGKYEVKTTDLKPLIEGGADLFGRTRKEISIHKRLQETLWPVEVDRGQIEQVLLNLYVNAWHAMPEGGELYIETKNLCLDQDRMTPYGLKPGRFVRISVTDTGTGMDEATLKRVFDPFFTTKEMGRGTGLGLASAYGIIRNHNGIINVYSEKGEGTTFNIYLPASDKQTQKQIVPTEAILRGTETILFVDDEEVILGIGKKLLERLGYCVIEATSGAEALGIFEKGRDSVRLVILDMIMPGMSGGETYDRLREIDPDVKVLLSSGYSINGQAKKILDRGCKGFIQKPYDFRDLSRRVRQALDS